MARVMLHQKLVNPAKRKLSLAQKRYFGTPRQRVAAKLVISGKGKTPKRASTHCRVSNPIGTIITLGVNPGKVGSMAKRKRNPSKRRVISRRNPVRRRKTNPFAVTHRRRSPSQVYYSRSRKVRNVRRRSNPGLAGTSTKVVSIIGGAALTKLVAGMLPATFQTGLLKYLATGTIAFGLGWGVGKVGKSAEVGENITIGGLTLVALQVLTDFVPGIAAYSGLGVGNVITGSSFYVPQVPAGNSMTQFVTPAGVPTMVAAPTHKGLKGVGRLAVSRSGY